LVFRLNEILLIVVLIGVASCQENFEEEEPDITPSNEGGPLVFPDPMQEASNEICIRIDPFFGPEFNETAWNLEWARLLNATNMTF